jgi:hypothetical protein
MLPAMRPLLLLLLLPLLLLLLLLAICGLRPHIGGVGAGLPAIACRQAPTIIQ